ncbi:MAG: ATP-binding protein [Marmoricola sp.]
MDPIRNPYAPGAGQRPPELAGRDQELAQFEITLERIAAGRPDRSMVLSGLRGVGKTVLLNSLRSMAVNRAWGTGKLEARPEQSIRIGIAQATHQAIRDIAHRHRDEEAVERTLGSPQSLCFAYAAQRPRSPELAATHRRTRDEGPRRLR